MSEKDKKKSYDLMQDTQYLLSGLDGEMAESYALEDILAEFSAEESVEKESAAVAMPVCELIPPSAAETPAEDDAQPEHRRDAEDTAHPNVIDFPLVPPPENIDDTLVVIDMKEYEDEEAGESAEALFGLDERRARPEPAPSVQSEAEPVPVPAQPRPLTMEDIVASTVDAVKAEREVRQREQRRRLEKERKKQEKKRQETHIDTPVPEVEEEQTPKEAAAFHKRRYSLSRRSFRLSIPILILLWIPWILAELGYKTPYFSAGPENAAVCIFAVHGLLCVVCAPLFRAAAEELREKRCTFYAYTALTNIVVLMDEMTVLILPGRGEASPLGSVSGCALTFALWGLTNYHKGMYETFRTAAMGRPSAVVDRGAAGICKGPGRLDGFVTRANMESTASQWQRLLLPVLIAASLIFALLASAGQGKGQSFLWCWSVILSASCALTSPLAYCVPFGYVAGRLNHSGTAVAGQYGAAALASSQKLAVTDMDIFPRSCVALTGVKLYGEERSRAISYTATLAVQGGGCMAQVFDHVCRSEHIQFQPLEHFHIHDDNGLSGMIRGETVLVGTPMFMRHRAVRLPATLPTKTAVCLAVDGELLAVFAVKYSVSPPVEIAMRSLARNGLQLILATRDGNVMPKMLRSRFGTDGKAQLPEISERLSLSDERREIGAPSGIIYRDGMYPYVELTALSRRLCQMVRVGNFLFVLGSVFGALLSFYLVFVGNIAVLTPLMLLTFLLLWTVPMIPLLIGVDRL